MGIEYDAEIVYTNGHIQMMNRVSPDSVLYFIKGAIESGHIAHMDLRLTDETDRKDVKERATRVIQGL